MPKDSPGEIARAIFLNLLSNKPGNSLHVGELFGLVDEIAAPALAIQAALSVSGTVTNNN